MLSSLGFLLLLGSTFTPRALWDVWPSQRFVTAPAPCLEPGALVTALRSLEQRHHGALTLEEVGRSVEGRPIQLLKLGRGPRAILLWSQMHGDEPSATPALLDVADFLLSRPDDEGVRLVLDRLTLLLIPMLNPDGAVRYQRRNAQAIDINRDALHLATPEGRLLKALRDHYRPELGFNLHDQNRRTTVGESGVLATISLLAVAGDPAGTVTAGRARARRACAAIALALEGFIPGGIARYDEDWNPRAFGDNLTAWGTPVVLIESGGPPEGRPLTELTRLNFVGLLTALHGLARDDLVSSDPAVYEGLKRNQTGLFADVILAGGSVLQPGAPEPYRADVAFEVLAGDRSRAGCAQDRAAPRIVEVGDARHLAAGRTIDATGAILVPGFVVSVRGLAARDWLTAERLETLALLGVTALRWHVEEGASASARSFIEDLPVERRPEIELVPADAPAAWRELLGPSSLAASRSLGAALDVLIGKRWRTEATSPAEILGRLATHPGPTTDPCRAGRIQPCAPGSLLVLRPGAGGLADPDAVRLERAP